MAHDTKHRDPNTPVERDERNPEQVEGHAPSAESPAQTVDDTARATAQDEQVAAPSKEALQDEADVLREIGRASCRERV